MHHSIAWSPWIWIDLSEEIMSLESKYFLLHLMFGFGILLTEPSRTRLKNGLWFIYIILKNVRYLHVHGSKGKNNTNINCQHTSLHLQTHPFSHSCYNIWISMNSCITFRIVTSTTSIKSSGIINT